MTANQRRPGFRLPWSSELGDAEAGAEAGAAEAHVAGMDGPAAPSPNGTPATAEPAPAPVPVAPAPAAPSAEASASPDFMRELVAAMRKVADEARESGVADARSRADSQVATVEAAADARRAEIQARAEQDIAAVGDWAQAEAARIKREAEEKVAVRRRQLEEQLAADATRTRDESDSVRRLAAAYEQELESYHAQLIEIEDPAAFAAAAKRMPQTPEFEPAGASAAPVEPAQPATPEPVTTPDTTSAGTTPAATAEPATAAAEDAPPGAEVHPAEEQVLAPPSSEAPTAAAEPASATASAEPAAAAARAEPITTDIVVKGLGSFGAITGFRQTLAGADGIDGVALSLGQTGEFVFRATHQPGLDIAGVIRALEGDGAKIETQGERSFVVSLDRAR